MDSRRQNADRVRQLSPLGLKLQTAIVVLGSLAFHVAFIKPIFGPFILVYIGCLIELTRATSGRAAFYSGLALGLLVFAPRLGFFYTIFGIAAAPLWLVLAFWHALFVHLGRRARLLMPKLTAALLLPILWTGLEYFRSELYPLRFSWLAPAFAFGPTPFIHFLGVYGTTFVLFALVSATTLLSMKGRILGFVALVALVFGIQQISPAQAKPASTVRIAGMQLEFPVELEVPAKLDLLKEAHPGADLYVLSEYTFDGPVPNGVRAWCKRNRKYLIVGGKDPAPDRNFYNTAFVIDPNGEIIFKQVKAVPIQFFKDGLPAPEQRLWNSQWGKIGLCVCYDLSYTRVIDRLVRQGAQIIINPTMDVVDWGEQQHQLHSLVPPMRAAEYGIPIFRLASSGISQAVDPTGRVVATAPFAGEQSTVAAEFPIGSGARLPFDRLLAPLATALTLAFIIFSVAKNISTSASARRRS
jgi:apolipoprotein N-acyltransferase